MFLMMVQNQPISDIALTQFHLNLTRMTNNMHVLAMIEHRKYFQYDTKIINKTESMVRKSKKKNESQ
jgi:hypothetical protein